MTRSAMEQSAYRWLNKATGTPATDTQTRVRAFLNAEMRDVLSRSGMEFLRAMTVPLTTVASQDTYGLPLECAKVSRVVDRTNGRTLVARDLGWLRSIGPDPATTGTPVAWMPAGYQAVQIQPLDASSLFAKSLSASDTTQTVRVEGFMTGGVPWIGSATLTGTTAVAIGTGLTTFEHVSKFYLSAVGVDVIGLYEDSGAGTRLAQIPVGYTSSRYAAIRLWPTPSAVHTLYVDGLAAITDLAQDTDVPPCPEDFHELFVLGACMRECVKLDDARSEMFAGLRADKLRSLKGWMNDHASNRLVSGSRRETGWSNLGGWYPAEWGV